MDRLTLSVADVAKALGISPAKAYEVVRTGRLPWVRIGRRILVPTYSLAHFLGQEPKVPIEIRFDPNPTTSTIRSTRWFRIIDEFITFLKFVRCYRQRSLCGEGRYQE